MKYQDEIMTENEVEDALMKSLNQSEFGKDFIRALEKHLNDIGTRPDFNQAEKIALTAYIFIETTDAILEDDADKVRPELLLAALDDASQFDKVIKKTDVDDNP